MTTPTDRSSARRATPCEGSEMMSEHAAYDQRWCLLAARYCKHATAQACDHLSQNPASVESGGEVLSSVQSSADDVGRARAVARRCNELVGKPPVVGRPDPLWWDRQVALSDAATKINELLATFPSREEVRREAFLEAAKVASAPFDWGPGEAPVTYRALADSIANRLRSLASNEGEG